MCVYRTNRSILVADNMTGKSKFIANWPLLLSCWNWLVFLFVPLTPTSDPTLLITCCSSQIRANLRIFFFSNSATIYIIRNFPKKTLAGGQAVHDPSSLSLFVLVLLSCVQVTVGYMSTSNYNILWFIGTILGMNLLLTCRHFAKKYWIF